MQLVRPGAVGPRDASVSISRYSKTGTRTMPNNRQSTKEQEPLGIVISRGSEDEPAPRFRAFVYAEVSETPPTSREVKAA